MKSARKITIKIFIISALLLCSGLNAYSNYNKNIFCIEFSESHNSTCLVSHQESLTDDQISQTETYSLLPDIVWCVLPSHTISLFPLSYVPIWQPPKILAV